MAPSRSLAASVRRIDGPWEDGDISVRSVAGYLGMSLPVSVLDMLDRLDALPTSRDWNASVTMGGGFALGGSVGLTVDSSGAYRFHGSLHDSGFDSYAFRVTAVVRAADDSVILAFVHSGSVGGTIEGGSRDYSWDEATVDDPREFSPRRLFIQDRWPALATASLTVTTTAEDEGVGGSLVSVLEDLAAFVIADVVLGPGLAVALLAGGVIGSELGLGAGPGELVGLLVAGGAIFLVANGVFLPVIPLAVTAGAITDTVVQHRHLTQEEEAFADRVFRGTLPSYKRIVLTNLAAVTGRALTWPNVDGSILLNMTNNTAYADPVHYKKDSTDPAGRLFIHELTHAWQMTHSDFMPMTICDAITGHALTEPVDGKRAYHNPGAPGLAWGDYNMEQQAVIVAMWYTGALVYGEQPVFQPKDENNPWFRYIAENIWLGRV